MQKSFAMAALLAASCGVQAASDADLAAIRAQIDDMKKTYEQRIASLEKKLAEAEVQAKSAKPAAEVKAAPAIVAAAPAATASARANGFNPEVSLILQGQYKNMKDVAERGITGFVPAGGHDEHAAGTVEGINKRGFSVNHTELILGASIDPYWRGQAILALADGEVEVEEAWFQSLAIGHGVGLKGGRVRSGIGYLNEQHPHMWDFADAPLMYRAMFGEHASYAQDGLQFKWLAPTPVFLEFGAEVGRGANFPGTDRNKNGAGAGAIFAHIGGDVGHSNAWRAGVSYLKTKASDREAEIEDTSGKHALGKFTGVFGAGWQAEGHIEAVAAVRSLRQIKVFARNAERLAAFCTKLSGRLGIDVRAAATAEEVVRDSDIVSTITTAATPLFEASWLSPGTHINAAGSNSLIRREVGEDVIKASNTIVVDSVETPSLIVMPSIFCKT